MTDKTSDLLERIRQERDRQRILPGSEWDSKNSINDWIATAGHYLNEPAIRKSSSSYVRGSKPSQEEFEECLVKAGAVILAALEHATHLKNNGDLR